MGEKRLIGLDIYRIMLATLVVIVHSCTDSTGGALRNTQLNSGSYFIGWLLFAFAIPAVNSFAVLSGFLSYDHKHSFNKIFVFWLELLFYSVGITVIAKFFVPVSTKEILLSFAPLSSGSWWYIGAYIITSLLMPALDYLVRESTWENYKKAVGILIAFICAGNAICLHKDIWLLNDGYTPFWISLLYVIGAGIKKYDCTNKLSHRKWGTLWLISVLITALSRYIIENVSKSLVGQVMGGGLLYNYLSITVVISAVCSLCYFATFKKRENVKVISFLAIGSFAGYIVHAHPVFVKSFLQDRYLEYGNSSNVLLSTGIIIFTAIVIVLSSAVLDSARKMIFSLIGTIIQNIKVRKRGL